MLPRAYRELCLSYNLLGAIKAWVTKALSGDKITDTIETMAAVVLAVLAICAVGAAYLTPTRRGNDTITVIFNCSVQMSKIVKI